MPRTPEQRDPEVRDGDLPLGSLALVRVAGMPWESWAAAGNEPLAARAVDLDRETARLVGRARALGERLGTEIVPDDRLAVADRRAVLALRRALHAGRAEAGRTDGSGAARPVHAAVAAVADLNPGLADALTALEREAAALADARELLAADVTAERARVGGALLSLARTHPVLHDFVTASSPRLLDDLARHVRAGEPWTGKRPRKGTGYVWRALARTAAKTTPRGWAGQLAAVPVTGDGGGEGGPGAGALLPYGARLDAVAAASTENVHRLWVSLRALDLRTAPPSTLLALTPLHRFTDDEFHCRAVDTGEAKDRAEGEAEGGGGVGVRGGSARLRRLALRRTPVLDAVLAVLADGPRALGDLEDELAGGHGEKGRTVLRGFLAHLLGLGVLQVCSVPESRRLEWTAGSAAVAKAPLRHPVPRGWFLDSYRTTDATVSAGAAARVTDGLRLARRLDALRALDAPDTSTEATPHTGPGWHLLDEAARIGTEPRPLLDILDGHDHDAGSTTNGAAADSGESVRAVPRARYEGWRPARTPGSAYARLLGHLAERLDEDSVDLDEAVLDALGAPPVPDWAENWPTDCLLRPLATGNASGNARGNATGNTSGESAAEPLAVLESASPAGVLDARFAEALDGLHEGGYANVRAYRAFLAAYERATGTRFVELLVPPLGEPAANAVRRPAVTTWCTGDPNTGLYHPPDDLGSVRHLPLHRVTLRRAGPDGGTLVAEADGVRLLPLHHGTRTPVPPYDRVLRLLTAAGHPALQYAVQLGGLAGAFPDAARVPRLTVGGTLVVSPAQWRVPRARLWRPADPEPQKAERLAALRRTAGLPRFGYVRTEPGGKPLPVDLAALPVFQAVERLCQSAPDGHDLWFEEALPTPADGAPALHDPAHGEPSEAGAGHPRGAGPVPESPRVATQLLLRLPHDRTADSLAALVAGATDLPGTRPSSDGGAPGRTHPHREVREGKHHACHRIA